MDKCQVMGLKNEKFFFAFFCLNDIAHIVSIHSK